MRDSGGLGHSGSSRDGKNKDSGCVLKIKPTELTDAWEGGSQG